MAGCGTSTPNNQSPANNGGIDIKVGNTNVQIQAGGSTAGLALPADFSTDVPIYSGANIKANLMTGKGEQATGMLHMQVPAATEKVGEYYRAELKNQGWTESQYVVTQAEGKTGTLIGAKKGSRILVVQVSADKEGSTIVNLTITGQ